VWTRLLRPAGDEDGVGDAVLTLTAIILLLRPFEVWWIAPFVLAVACLSLTVRAIRRAPITWFVLASLIAARIAVVWPLSDNHIYLLGYWCLAIGLAQLGPRGSDTISTSSRFLLAAAFAFAVIWKAGLSPDYLDGRFFRVTLLTDARFADASLVLGGLSRDQMAVNREFLVPLPEGAALLEPPPFIEPPRLRLLAATATFGGLALEAAIALLNLLPAAAGMAAARHAALLLFCVTTYALAPVAGFGWLLAAMGLSQCGARDRLLKAAYVAVFILILLYSELPWTSVVQRAFGIS
jgi:hypothetical protein